jgi:NitT/TauT family transport system permease protein
MVTIADSATDSPPPAVSDLAWRRAFVGFLHRNAWSVASAVVVIIAWEVVARLVNYPYMPPVSDVLAALWRLLGEGTIATALGTSLEALGYGLAIAILAGTTLGALMGLSATARYALNVYVDAIMSAPMTAFVPLFILLFGLGIETRVIVVSLFAFFPIVVNTQAGLLAADPELIQMARSFGAGPVRTFFRVRLPMSYRHIQAGLRMGVARGVDGNVTGEVLIAAVGLGGLVTQYGRAFSSDRLFAVVIVIVIMSFTAIGMTRLFGRVAFGMRG